MRGSIAILAFVLMGCTALVKLPDKSPGGDVNVDTLSDTVEAVDDAPDIGDAVDGEELDPCSVFPKWCFDADMDGYGRDDVFVCAETAPGGYVETCGDCCDGDDNVYPGQLLYYTVPYTCPEESWDYNCDDGIARCLEQVLTAEECEGYGYDECVSALPGWMDTVPDCGEPGSATLSICNWSGGSCHGAIRARIECLGYDEGIDKIIQGCQ